MSEQNKLPEYYEHLEGDWIKREYIRKREVRKFKYIGLFVPNEPFLAVFYNEEKDDLDTMPVYAVVARVVLVNHYGHYVDFLPVVAWPEGDMMAVGSWRKSDYVGFVPARLYEKVRDDLLKMARLEYELIAKSKQEQKQSHEG